MSKGAIKVVDYRFETEAKAIEKREKLLRETDGNEYIEVFFDESFSSLNWFCRIEK